MKTIEQEINEATARWGVKHDAEKCPDCKGDGWVEAWDYSREIELSQTCHACRGKGYIIVEVAA